MIRKVFSTLALLLALALALPGGAARAQLADPLSLPDASNRQWTAHRLTRSEPPYVNGAVAQVSGRGEGRFMVICRRGDDRGVMAYRPPPALRQVLRDQGDEIQVRFTFDRDERIERRLRWDEEAGVWRGPFGPRSGLARQMKRRFNVEMNVIGLPGADSEYTLKNSWASIEAMFRMCRI